MTVPIDISLKQKVREDNLSLVSAGVGFYSLLALFPGTAVLVSSYGLFADLTDIAAQVRAFPGLPDAAKQVLIKHLQELASSSPAALSLGFIGALLFSIWSASRATKALLIAILPAGLRNLGLPALQTVDKTNLTEPWMRSWYFSSGSGSRLSWSCWEPSSTPRSSVGV
jgi:hypothetical protein